MSKKNTPTFKQPPLLFERTQQVFAKLQKALGGPLLSYYNSDNGGTVCANDIIGFDQVLRKHGRIDELYLFIKSDGGSITSALRIVHLLRHFARRVVAVLPLECASAATLMALGADRILMGPQAFLTPIDSSLTHALSPVDKDNDLVRVSQNEMTRIINLWNKDNHEATANPYQEIFKYIHPLVIGAVDRMNSLSIRVCTEILTYHMADEAKARQISECLNNDYPTHGYPITLREAQRLGLHVDGLPVVVNDLLMELSHLYSEMAQSTRTDVDQENHHINNIVNLIEAEGIQFFYQLDKDWFYRKEERRWFTLNNNSAWHRVEMVKGKLQNKVFHIY